MSTYTSLHAHTPEPVLVRTYILAIRALTMTWVFEAKSLSALYNFLARTSLSD